MKQTWLRNVRVETHYLKHEGFTYGAGTEAIDVKMANGLVTEIQPHDR